MESVSQGVSSSPARKPRRWQEIFWQALQYGSGSGLTILASLISYPILTRIFTQSEYGLLALISNSLSLLVSTSKVGMQNAAIRFYPEYATPDQGRALRSTLVLAPLVNGFGLALLACLIAWWTPSSVLPFDVKQVIVVASPIVALEAAKMLLLNFLRAGRRSGRYATLSTIDKYGQMGSSIGVLILLHRGLVGFYAGWLAWNLCLVGALLLGDVKARSFSLAAFDRDVLRKALVFSGPLVFMELGGLVLTYGDRYIIAKYMGTSPTGVYAAAYNFTMAIQNLLIIPLNSIIFPWASEIWTKHSKEEAADFGTKMLNYFFVVGVAVFLGVSVLREPIMAVFASSKYNEAARLLPPLIAAQVLFGLYQIVSLGLFLVKRTTVMAGQIVVATIFNIGVNFWMVPHYGLMGAALATLLAYVLLVVIASFSSLPLLRIRLDMRIAAKALASGALMWLVISFLPTRTELQRLVLGTAVGAAVYGGSIILLDAQLRRFMQNLVHGAKS